ncbi:MAG: hypothetical protein LBG81_03315, partial [Coriobacteriaceae bacterium]|nr:hypothetical protein [Coriobacteriaceae bacterium]
MLRFEKNIATALRKAVSVILVVTLACLLVPVAPRTAYADPPDPIDNPAGALLPGAEEGLIAEGGDTEGTAMPGNEAGEGDVDAQDDLAVPTAGSLPDEGAQIGTFDTPLVPSALTDAEYIAKANEWREEMSAARDRLQRLASTAALLGATNNNLNAGIDKANEFLDFYDDIWNNGRPKVTYDLLDELRTKGYYVVSIAGQPAYTSDVMLLIAGSSSDTASITLSQAIEGDSLSGVNLPSPLKTLHDEFMAEYNRRSVEIAELMDLTDAVSALRSFVEATDYSTLTSAAAIVSYVNELSTRYTAVDTALAGLATIQPGSPAAGIVTDALAGISGFTGDVTGYLAKIEARIDAELDIIKNNELKAIVKGALGDAFDKIESKLTNILSNPTLDQVIAYSAEVKKTIGTIAGIAGNIQNLINTPGLSGDVQVVRDALVAELDNLRDYVNDFVAGDSSSIINRIDALLGSVKNQLTTPTLNELMGIYNQLGNLWRDAIVAAVNNYDAIKAAIDSLPPFLIERTGNPAAHLTKAANTTSFEEQAYAPTVAAVAAKINQVLADQGLSYRINYNLMPITPVDDAPLPAGFTFANGTLTADASLFAWTPADGFSGGQIATTRDYTVKVQLLTGITELDELLAAQGIPNLKTRTFTITLDLDMPTITVAFDPTATYSGTASLQGGSFTYGQTPAGLGADYALAETGYVFEGWFYDATTAQGGWSLKVFNADGTFALGGAQAGWFFQGGANVTLTAHWSPATITVAFDPTATYSGTASLQGGSFTYGQTPADLGADYALAETGYVFEGWFYDATTAQGGWSLKVFNADGTF